MHRRDAHASDTHATRRPYAHASCTQRSIEAPAMHKRIRASVQRDKQKWLEDMLIDGHWGPVKKLRKGESQKQGRLKDMRGDIVSSEQRAETLAEYLEKVQWAVHPITMVDSTRHLGPGLPVNEMDITDDEVLKAAQKLNRGKTPACDNLPPEFWKAICETGTAANRWPTLLCQKCWSAGYVPEAWHKSRVAMIFKKGDVSEPGNYRPISLLPIGYKLFASILLSRLKDAGAESRIWETQYGFCSGRSTFDAVFLARRLLEQNAATKDTKLILLALDWAKAFDCISPDSLMLCLARFGVPPNFVRVIQAIYTNRCFYVADAGVDSPTCCQRAGICQGCPLSPFLFSILMTVLISDAKNKLETQGVRLSTNVLTNELLYADDTLIVDTDRDNVQRYMEAIADAGSNYGLSFNWGKLEILSSAGPCLIPTPSGSHIKQKGSIVYLGSLLQSDGSCGSELSRRLGEATSVLNKLCRVWSHANISGHRKIQIYVSCVVSKLMYNLPGMWFNTAEVRKLDAFHNRVLRKILHIPPSYYSRVSNQTVLEWAGQAALSQTLLKRQLLHMGRIARRPDEDVLRRSIFADGTFLPTSPTSNRKRGRPRATWAAEVHKRALEAAGNESALVSFWQATKTAAAAWKRRVTEHCI